MKGRNRVTIGVPVHNEGNFIEITLISAVHQCEVLFVSDNDSSDESFEKCHHLAQLHENIYLVRQDENIGAHANFRLLLEQATTEYFMWLGGHDLLPNYYVQELQKWLDSRVDCVMAFGAVEHVNANGDHTYAYNYDFAHLFEDPDPCVRVMAILQNLTDCSLVHGLFRTSASKRAWMDASFLGGDHVFLARAALLGKFIYLPNISYVRRDPHLVHTREAQLKRIQGASHDYDSSSNNFKEMQRQLYSIACGCSTGNGSRGTCYRVRARFALTYRFGFFGETPAEKVWDFVLLNVGKIVRKISILFGKYVKFIGIEF